jgi:hypothetical protein
MSADVEPQMDSQLKIAEKPKASVRYSPRLVMGFGGLLVLAAMLVAVVFPPLVPRAQRIEVFMMSLAFGVIGTGALVAGAWPSKDTMNSEAAKPVAVRSVSGKALLQKRKPLHAVWGLGFGALFFVAGIVAPFVLGQANADDRFLMMIGFAPVAVTGALMIAIFWRAVTGKPLPSMPSPKPAAKPAAHKPVVTRAPDQTAFKLGVPLLIGISLLILIAVLALVVVATVIPILNR